VGGGAGRESRHQPDRVGRPGGAKAREPHGHAATTGLRPAPPPDLAGYSAQLLRLSQRIVGAVHDEGTDAIQQAVDRALIVPAPPGVDPAVALAVVLAGQINPDTTATQRLAWLP